MILIYPGRVNQNTGGGKYFLSPPFRKTTCRVVKEKIPRCETDWSMWKNPKGYMLTFRNKDFSITRKFVKK